MNHTKITKAFKSWAKSFSGCDGGNPNGSIWFCGIEYGGSKFPDFVPLKEPTDISEESFRKSYFKYQYDRKVMKLYGSILGAGVSEYRNVFQITNAFRKESDVFKMNLYPIAFKNDWKGHWTKELYEKTGLISKTHYLAWCQLNRFPIIKSWIATYQPKILIGTGSTYSLEYTMAFCGIESTFITPYIEEIEQKNLIWILCPDSKILLFVIPFLGPGGLMRDDHIELYGKRIAAISEKFHGSNWCKSLDEFKTN